MVKWFRQVAKSAMFSDGVLKLLIPQLQKGRGNFARFEGNRKSNLLLKNFYTGCTTERLNHAAYFL